MKYIFYDKNKNIEGVINFNSQYILNMIIVKIKKAGLNLYLNVDVIFVLG